MHSSTGSPHDSTAMKKKTYDVDIRVYLSMIVTAMGIAFGIGVSLGPSPYLLRNIGLREHESPELPPGHTRKIDWGGRKVTSTPRNPVKHIFDIGEEIKEVHESHVNVKQPILEDLGDGVIKYSNPERSTTGVNDVVDQHLPAGQHVLVDIKNVNADFLNSEERLAGAMVDVIRSAGLTLLSYHCHSLLPSGVSCVGVILESHISFHTWPVEGVITLDLFTCGSAPLLPVVPEIKRLFGVPRFKENSTDFEEVICNWSHELRGFRNSEERTKHILDNTNDLASSLLSSLETTKTEVVSVKTPHHRIDIWEVIDRDSFPTYLDAKKAGLEAGDPRWFTNEVSSPEKWLFLDGKLQNLEFNEIEYYEALVHPSMFAHPNPTNVAIVGGGKGAALREVLKHETVETAIVIEIDELLVPIVREHAKYLTDCSDLIGSMSDCYEDKRSVLINEHPKTWFSEHYSENSTKVPLVQKFDVIIIDPTDHEYLKDYTEILFNDSEFLNNLYDSLNDNGVVGIQVGNAPSIHDPRADLGEFFRREKILNILEHHEQTAAVFIYEESHSGFGEPSAYLVACKNPDCRRRWYATSDSIDYQIYERIIDTKSDDPALVHFDGSTQYSYQSPSRGWETVYCRREPVPFECAFRGLDLTKDIFEFDPQDEDNNSFEIRKESSENGDITTSVYALKGIPEGSYIMPSAMAASFIIRDESMDNLNITAEVVGTGEVTVIKDFISYVENYGHKSIAKGSGLTYVEVGWPTMMRYTFDKNESNIGRWMPPPPTGKLPSYSPVYERNMHSFDVFMVATKDIKKGEQLARYKDEWNLRLSSS